jgi:hypothetical protein
MDPTASANFVPTAVTQLPPEIVNAMDFSAYMTPTTTDKVMAMTGANTQGYIRL